jgi:hypothetical protein
MAGAAQETPPAVSFKKKRAIASEDHWQTVQNILLDKLPGF